MKRFIPIALLAVGMSGTAHAQGPQDVVTLLNNVDGALNGAVSHGQAGTLALLEGDVTNTFNNFEQAQSGFATDLAANTPGEPLAETYDQLSRDGYEALVPLYQQLDGPAMQVADALAPLAEPTSQAVRNFELLLLLEFDAPALPGAGGEAGVPGLDGIPGLDALGTDALPLDALDPSTLTALADGGALPGLPQ